MDGCSEQLSYFYATIIALLNKHMPVQHQTVRATDKPWITSGYKDLIRKRQRAYKEGKQHLYKYLKNRINRVGKRLRRNYYNSQIDGLVHANPRQWWRKTKQFLGQGPRNNNDFVGIINNNYDGDADAFVQAVNCFLQSVSKHLKPVDMSQAPSVKAVPSKYIISVEEVEERLLKVDLHKAPGADDIPNWVLKDLAQHIAKPVCAIYNASIRNSFVPEQWKSANITPLAKVKPPQEIEADIRPISLLPVLGKLLGKQNTWGNR